MSGFNGHKAIELGHELETQMTTGALGEILQWVGGGNSVPRTISGRGGGWHWLARELNFGLGQFWDTGKS